MMKDERTELKSLFAQIVPPQSDDELLNAVLERKAENMSQKNSRKLKKAVVIPIAAALALGISAAGVSAASTRTLGDMFSEMFAKNYTEYSPQAGEAPYFDFTGIGKEINRSYERDFGRINILGVAADLHTAYLLYDIEFNEDFCSSAEDEIWQPNLRGEVCQNAAQLMQCMVSDGIGGYGEGFTDEIIGFDGRTTHCAARVTLSDDTFEHFSLHFSMDTLSRSGGESESESIEFEPIDLDITLDFDIKENSLVITEEKPAEILGYEAVITHVEISTFGAEIQLVPKDLTAQSLESMYDAMNKNQDECGEEIISCVLKDGTEFAVDTCSLGYKCGSDSEGKLLDNCWLHIYSKWLTPVLMENIEAIRVGSCTIELEQAQAD